MELSIYESGLDILERHAKSYDDGRTRVLLFFLGSKFDENFLRDIINLADDIDHLTGPHCLAVAFTPAPPVERKESWCIRPEEYLRRTDKNPDQAWQAFSREMSKNTYQLVRYLGVPAKHLPCLAFINPAKPNEAALLRLYDGTLRSIYPKLRDLFVKWYQDYQGTLDQWDYLTAYVREGCRSTRLPASFRAAIRKHLTTHVIPGVADMLLQLVPRSDLEYPRFRQLLNRLPREPWNTEAIDEFLQTRRLSLRVCGFVYWSLRDYFVEVYERDILTREQAREDLRALRAQLPDFPLERVKALSEDIEITSIPGHGSINGVMEQLLRSPALAQPIENHYYGVVHMARDSYNFERAGSVGPRSSATNVTFNECAATLAAQLDLKALAAELERLKGEMVSVAKEPSHYEAIAAVAKAEDEVKKGETASVISQLKAAGQWAFDIASRIGVSVAAKAIQGAMGL